MKTLELNNKVHTSTKINENSKAVEIFSSLVKGQDTNKFGKNVDTVMTYVKDLAQRAVNGDHTAMAEINAFVKFTLQPDLKERIDLYRFIGKFSRVGYGDAVMLEKYKHVTRSSAQANQGDVPLSTFEKTYEPMNTHNISGGFAVNYRELATGNLDKVSEGIDQVKIDMYNKGVLFIIETLYNSIKNATGVKYFAEAAGITKNSVDDVLRKVRRYGKPSIVGDYSVVSQLNGFQGYADGAPNAYSDAALEELRKTGLLGMYSGSPVMELPNQYDRTELNGAGDNYNTLLPEGLMFLIPSGNNGRYPLQIVQRGDISSMSGDDIVTGTHMMRFDYELGCGVAYPDAIGLISDTNFDAPGEVAP